MDPNPIDARPLSPINKKDAEEIVDLLNKAPSRNISTQTLEDKDDLKRAFQQSGISQPNLGSNDTEMVFPTNNQGMIRTRTVDDLYKEMADDEKLKFNDKNYLPETEAEIKKKKLVEKYYLKRVVVVKRRVRKRK